MKKLADDVYLLDGFPPYAINVYLVGDVLVDAGTRHATKRILRGLKGRSVAAHALTHVHPDHQGSSHEVCEWLGIPLWCGELDAEPMENGRLLERMPSHPLNRLIDRVWTGPPHPVGRRLHEGDVVAGFQVLDTPGHSAGHVSFWRQADRILICGDVLYNLNALTGLPGLHEPPDFFSPDPQRNRESIRRVAQLDPDLICFGHGAPLRDRTKLKRFTGKLTA